MRDIEHYKEESKRGWAGGRPETACGAGSTMLNTAPQRNWLPLIISKYNIQSIADIGCGDQKWIRTLNLPGYQGYDLVPRRQDVIEFDIIRQVPPKVDMILCLWVLNHLDPDDMKQAFDNIKKSGSKYFVTTRKEQYIEDNQLLDNMECLESVEVPNQTKAEVRLYIL